MLNVGADFGSTYSMVSYFKDGKLEAVFHSQGANSPMIPTVLAISEKKNFGKRYGNSAKNVVGKKGFRTFQSFKMLLTETNEEILRERGYSENLSPRVVSKEFLERMICSALKQTGEKEIGKLVIGAPEIWFKTIRTMEGRNILRDICRELNIEDASIREVQVVSEPAAACAFFAYNYYCITGKNFEGTVLLVDYGGGTLDNSLAKVGTTIDENGNQAMEIKIIESNGAGESHDGKIGRAGIIYMESVVEEAIRAAGLLKEGEELQRDGNFYKTVNEFETELQNGKQTVDETFEALGTGDLEDLEEEEFVTLTYAYQGIPVTYRMLVEVYDREIRGIFDEKLEEMKAFIEDRGETNQNFKIALVGGFGKFYLVREQIREKFMLYNGDPRLKGIITAQSDCEKAISFGAALLASDVIRIKSTAPYSIAIPQFLGRRPVLDYAFKYKEDIEYDKIYFSRDSETGLCIPTLIASDEIGELVINFGHSDNTAVRVPLKKKFRHRLANIPAGQYHTVVFGFSLDPSEVLTMHIRRYNLATSEMDGDDRDIQIPLARYNELFEISKVQKVLV